MSGASGAPWTLKRWSSAVAVLVAGAFLLQLISSPAGDASPSGSLWAQAEAAPRPASTTRLLNAPRRAQRRVGGAELKNLRPLAAGSLWNEPLGATGAATAAQVTLATITGCSMTYVTSSGSTVTSCVVDSTALSGSKLAMRWNGTAS